MKKVVSIVLITIILLSCCITTAFASGKITDTLQEQIDKADEDGLIRVQMWIRKPNYTSDEIEMLALKKAGLPLLSAEPLTMDELNRFIVAKRNIIFDLDATASREALGKIGIPDDRIVEISGLCVTVYMKPSEITTASEVKEVSTLLFDVVDDSLYEPVSESSNQLSDLYLNQFEELCDKAGVCCEYYQELYYHYDSNGNMDWVLVEGSSDIDYPGGYYCSIGNRVFVRDSYGCPFNANYGIFDVNSNSFVDISFLKNQGYDDCVTVFDQYGGGRLLGDLDKDNEISVVDATILQRCDARLMDYSKDDLIDMYQQIDPMFSPLTYYSDFNRDGVRDILDVTYIQRYLVGMTSPLSK